MAIPQPRRRAIDDAPQHRFTESGISHGTRRRMSGRRAVCRILRPWRGCTAAATGQPPTGIEGKQDLARETDFLDLYKILGLQPGCGLDEFKHAYRRRVSVLHPDRRDNDTHHVVAAERLQRLTALYGMAMEFHREHGRLPGAPLARSNTPMPATNSSQP